MRVEGLNHLVLLSCLTVQVFHGPVVVVAEHKGPIVEEAVALRAPIQDVRLDRVLRALWARRRGRWSRRGGCGRRAGGGLSGSGGGLSGSRRCSWLDGGRSGHGRGGGGGGGHGDRGAGSRLGWLRAAGAASRGCCGGRGRRFTATSVEEAIPLSVPVPPRLVVACPCAACVCIPMPPACPVCQGICIRTTFGAIRRVWAAVLQPLLAILQCEVKGRCCLDGAVAPRAIATPTAKHRLPWTNLAPLTGNVGEMWHRS
mmetsp:Transcript_84232/g.233471  ORF Transcript_84232/g.233471 Transcript_84232/m.233471 type:complete len:257 (+) Transcript_84232:1069-1839(+)